MKNKKNFYRLILLLFVCTSSAVFQGFGLNKNHGKIDPKFAEILHISANEEEFLIWVDLTDKGINTGSMLRVPELCLTERAIKRRLKVKDAGNIIDYTDLPVNYVYLNEIKGTGVKVKQVSKWFNSVSCYANKVQIDQLIKKGFVARISQVMKFKKEYAPKELYIPVSRNPQQVNTMQFDNAVIEYGPSFYQSHVINVPTAHNNGYMGQGVLIASFDTGVDNLGHPCFDSIRARGIRTFDFVNGDTSIANDPGQMGEGSHGTLTLSLVGGNAPGNLVSPAFRSQFIVAKTENTDSETPVEEDNWIAAAEWADSLGADIITSSLGYLGFDPGSAYSYDWTWLNGDSCKITIAADLTVNKGIIVVNSAGNNGFNASHNTLNAPADGDSVLTIGSIDSNLQRSGFSSVGPTTDGRFKPDVMAMGSGNVCAQPNAGNTGYTSFVSGTSLSAPMVAGVCAMMLSSNPNITPMKVVNILRNTASNSSNPDNLIGWGTINAWTAVQQAIVSIEPVNGNVPESFELRQNYPNPFNPVTIIPFSVNTAAQVHINVYNTLGEKVAMPVNGLFQKDNYNVSFNASAFGLASGVYYYDLIVNNEFIAARKMVLAR